MGFKVVCEARANGCIDVQKFYSEETKLKVVIAQVPGPLVSGYFVLATEAFDDDGLPHTLEHLIFIGSEQYPYKGVLDLVANRNLASGTNAWTDTDHTCYTMKTAGSEGFLNLLPVYLDHILYPTLTEEGYLTEVHHITGDGQDAGVVYCEMQGRENSGESRVHLEMLRVAYPGKCGYKSETGGLMKNLRESTNNKKVRDYHKEFYCSENLTLIITGQVEPAEVLRVLEGIEKKIIGKGPRSSPFERPWQSPVPPLEKAVDIVVPFASDEEDNGMVYMAWRGPSAVHQIYRLGACAILLRYLTDSSISPLQKEFVEISDPLASNVGFSLQENSESLLYITFENVVVPKLSEVKSRLEAKLREIVDSPEPIDLKRLHSIINRQKLETLLNLETQPHSSIAFMIIGDVLYGNTNQDLEQRLNPIADLDKMAAESASFWLELLKEYLINSPSVTVRGKPSTEEKARLASEEEIRISLQVEELGEAGLAAKAEALDAANTANNIPPPSELLTASPVPDPRKIVFHSVSTYSTDSPPEASFVDLSQLPIYAHFDDVLTNFIYLTVLIDTNNVPENLRMYLPLYMNAVLELPVLRDGKLIPHDVVVAELEQDTVATSAGLGLGSDATFSCSPYGQTACLTLQVEPAKYEKGVRWLHDLLYGVQFTGERLSIIAAKIVNEVAEFRRKGNSVTKDIATDLNFKKGNNNYFACNMIRQQKFLSQMGKDLTSGVEKSLAEMEQLRAIITDPKNIVVRIAANLQTISSQVKNMTEPWKNFLPKSLVPSKKSLAVTKDSSLVNSAKLDKPVTVLGLGSVESAFLMLSVPCIDDFMSPDLAPLMVLLQYIVQLEGPMWKEIRGLGLSYGYDIRPRPNDGLLYFSLYRSTNVLDAIIKSRDIVYSLLEETAEFDPVLLDSAKSSLIFEVIDRENTIADAIKSSMLAYFKGVDIEYNRTVVGKVTEVTIGDLKRVGKEYVSKLFEPESARASLVCHPNKAQEVAAGLTKLGFRVSVAKSLNEVFLQS